MNDEPDLMQVTSEKIKVTNLQWDAEGRFTSESQVKVKRYLNRHWNLMESSFTTPKDLNQQREGITRVNPSNHPKWDMKSRSAPGPLVKETKGVGQSRTKGVKGSKAVMNEEEYSIGTSVVSKQIQT